MRTTYYFAYGSNLNIGQMAQRCPSAEPIGAATLRGFRLVFRGVADVIESDGDTVTGGVWEITGRDLEALDRYEGFPHLYGRRRIEVELESGETVDALVYTMKRGGFGAPSPYYYETIREGYGNFGLSDYRSLMLTALFPDGSYRGRTPLEIVQRMRSESYVPSRDCREYMRQVAKRMRVQSGAKVETSSPDKFLATLARSDDGVFYAEAENTLHLEFR